MQKNLDNKYFITYSNYFIFENRVFAFRKKLLFDITNLPTLINEVDNNNCIGFWINRKFLSLSKIKNMIIKDDKTIDVSSLQWYQQIDLDLCCNIKQQQ